MPQPSTRKPRSRSGPGAEIGDPSFTGSNGDLLVAMARGGTIRVSGGSGNDSLFGPAGNDTLRGDGGSDILTGGFGSDRLQGGADEDVFVFAADGALAMVTDFTPGLDLLDFRAIGVLKGDLALETGANLLIVNDLTQVLLLGVTLAELNIADDFLY